MSRRRGSQSITSIENELTFIRFDLYSFSPSPKRGSNVAKSKKLKTEVASTVDADTSASTSTDISSTFNVAGGDTTMSSIEDESEEKVHTSATSLRRSTREKHTRFEAVKENDSESELSDEDEGHDEAQNQDDASSDDENERVDGNQSEEAEVKMEGIEEGEEAKDQDLSFVMMEDGKVGHIRA